MEEKELDLWFTSITVRQKEHIARKVLCSEPVAHNSSSSQSSHTYPNCTRIWSSLPKATKQNIHDHCTDSHGMWAIEENHITSLGHDF